MAGIQGNPPADRGVFDPACALPRSCRPASRARCPLYLRLVGFGTQVHRYAASRRWWTSRLCGKQFLMGDKTLLEAWEVLSLMQELDTNHGGRMGSNMGHIVIDDYNFYDHSIAFV